MDNLLLDLSVFSQHLLPILGAIALAILCYCLWRLAKLADGLTKTIQSLDPTIQKLDESMAKVQAPLDTAVKYSHTMDEVHDKTKDAISKAGTKVSQNIEQVKKYFEQKSTTQIKQEGELQDESQQA